MSKTTNQTVSFDGTTLIVRTSLRTYEARIGETLACRIDRKDNKSNPVTFKRYDQESSFVFVEMPSGELKPRSLEDFKSEHMRVLPKSPGNENELVHIKEQLDAMRSQLDSLHQTMSAILTAISSGKPKANVEQIHLNGVHV